MSFTDMFTSAAMAPDDLQEVLELWARTAGVGLNESDTPAALTHFLARNPGLSLVARKGTKIVAAVLCGHDGRRGSLYHLAVAPECRRSGLGRKLVEECLTALGELGIQKCNIVVYRHNADGKRFWEQLGFRTREDLDFWQRMVEDTS